MPSEFVMISTADWDNPFWTNKQHIAKRLADRGYKVLYVNSLGLRKPSGSRKDLGRIARRLGQFFGGLNRVHPNLWVWSPIAIPYHKFRFVRKLNFLIVRLFLQYYIRKLKFRDYATWTYNPISEPLIGLDERLSVYHCVDEISAQPGMPETVIKSEEGKLLESVDLVFATSPLLYETRKAANAQTYYSPNVADFAHFTKARQTETEIPPDIRQFTGPKVGFIGAINGYKLDLPLLKEAAANHPEVHFLLIGQIGEGDPWTDVGMLENSSNIHLLGPRPYDSLPGYIKAFDVCLLPNVLNEYTKFMFPMKYFEYLSAGKPVVMTPLPALRDYYRCGYVAGDSEVFSRAIGEALNERSRADYPLLVEERIAEARRHDWEARLDDMLGAIRRHAGRKGHAL